MRQLVVAHCMPVYDSVEFDAAQSVQWLIADWLETMKPRMRLKLCAVRGQPVTFVRERLVELARCGKAPREEDPHALVTDDGSMAGPGDAADVILFQDSDVSVPDSSDYLQLVKDLVDAPDDVALVGAACVQQEKSGGLVVNVNMNDIPGGIEATKSSGPFVCTGIGFGLVAIRASVFDLVERPWFRMEMTPDSRMVGEDLGFTDRVRALGYKVMCDPRIDAVHSFRRAFSLRDTRLSSVSALSGGG